jgi:hypothetical protein
LKLPNLGIIPVYDKEANRTIWVNTSSKTLLNQLSTHFSGNQAQLEKFSRQNKVNYLSVNTEEDFVPSLVKLFRVRNIRQK